MTDSPANDPVLRFDDLSYRYTETGFGLQNINGGLYAGEHTVVIGVSGSGKSTLLSVAAGLLTPTKGCVLLQGMPVAGPDERLVPGHEDIVLMRQQPDFSPRLTCKQQLMHHLRAYQKPWALDEADRLLNLCGLSSYTNRVPQSMSGGEQQRLSLAIALSTHPDVLLLDEPLSKIDPHQKAILASDLKQIAAAEGVACLWVLHEPELALNIADHVWVLAAGQMLQQGAAEQVYYQPINYDIGELLGPINKVPTAMLPHQGLLRPTQFTLHTELSDGGWQVTVVESQFMGLYYLVSVQLDAELIVVVSNQPYQAGLTLWVMIRPQT